MKLNTKQNICRACLTKEGLFHIVFAKESSSGVSLNISEMLSACATIQVKEGDGLPDQICSECTEQTVKLYLFKLRCEKSDIILRESLKKCRAESVKIKNKHEGNAIDNCNEDIKNNDHNCEIDEEMWEKNEEKIIYEALKEQNKIKELKNDFCQESVNQDDLLTSQEIVDAMKVEKLEGIDEDIEIKYNSLIPHLIESKESFFPCLECNSIFYEKKNLDEHINDLHNKKEPEMSSDENLKRKQKIVKINSLLQNKPLINFYKGCEICFKGFSQKSELKKHTKTHTSTSKETGKQLSILNVVCDKRFRKSYDCDICEKTFRFSSNLSYHKRTHTGEKPYECDVCRKTFSQSHALVRHKRIHTGEKPYECEICKKNLTNSTNLKIHKRNHTGEKPYECDKCQKRFKRLEHLTQHKRIHTGEKPYECEVCKKRFKQLGNLTNHKRLHTGEKPFKCDICNRKFTQASGLSYHKTLHTGKKPYECKVCNKRFITMGNLGNHKATGQCL